MKKSIQITIFAIILMILISLGAFFIQGGNRKKGGLNGTIYGSYGIDEKYWEAARNCLEHISQCNRPSPDKMSFSNNTIEGLDIDIANTQERTDDVWLCSIAYDSGEQYQIICDTSGKILYSDLTYQ